MHPGATRDVWYLWPLQGVATPGLGLGYFVEVVLGSEGAIGTLCVFLLGNKPNVSNFILW